MNEQKCRKLVYERSQRVCEKCFKTWATEVHHRVNRSQGGKWTPANCLHLCHPCHHWCTVHPEESREQGRWSLKSFENPLNHSALRCGQWVFLDDSGDYRLDDAA